MSSIVGSYNMADEPMMAPENASPEERDLSAAPTYQYDRPQRMEEDIKPGKADFFYGDAHQVEDWLGSLHLQFMFMGSNIKEQHKSLYAASLMKKRARQWINPHLPGYIKGPQHQGKNKKGVYLRDEDYHAKYYWMKEFHLFEKEIRRTFGISNPQENSGQAIQRLRQKGSAKDYSILFQHHANLSEWNDTSLRSMYYRGLHRNIKNAMVHHHDEVNSLSDLIRVSIDLDNRLRNRFFEDGGNSRPHQGNRGNHSAPRGPPRSHEQANAQGYYGAMPMELNTMKQQPRGNRPQRGRGGYQPSKRSSCYNCGKPGHKAANCGSRNTNKVRRRINVITTSDRDGSDREEWEIVENNFRLRDMEELHRLRQLDDEEIGNLTVDQCDLLDFPELEMQYRVDCEQNPTENEASDFELDAPDTQQIIHTHYQQLREETRLGRCSNDTGTRRKRPTKD